MKPSSEIFLADTYALIEMLGGNENYRPYLDVAVLTTELNLAELFLHLLRDYNEKTADRYMKLFSRILVPLTLSSIKSAMKFKHKFRKEKLSYADCIGHALAKELNIRFLTGDIKFKEKDNVEWVK